MSDASIAASRAAPTSDVQVTGDTLSLGSIISVARWGTPVHLSTEVMDAVGRSVQLKNKLVAKGEAIYGVTTGFGDSADRQLSPDRAAALQRSLVNMMGCGMGRHAPLEEARATVLIRANCLARGHSAVRPAIIERLLLLLNHGVTPAIPEQGSVGASGDLVPLSYLAAVLCGEREVFYEQELMPAKVALSRLGLEPLKLQSKEALALLNGTAYMAGVACLAAYDAQTVALTADLCTALTTEVLRGMQGAFSPFLHDVTKPHQGQMRSARNVRALLRGSAMVFDGDSPGGEGPTRGVKRLSQRVQNSYSVRCAPHFIGAMWDTLDWVERWLCTEVNSSTDNPLFDIEAGAVATGGNFAGSHVGLASDALRTATASVGDLIDRQLASIVDERHSNGLPANLAAPVPPGHPEAGIRHGFKGLQIACSSLTAEALHLCTPVTAFSRSTECHNQDKVSMATIAARRTREVVRHVENVLACHLLALCQAAELRGKERLGATRPAFERIRTVSPALEGDRELERDIAAVARLIRDRELLQDLPMQHDVAHVGAAQ
ncbi:MAG: aromatic amino acid ammonia-lyase [Myxococcales bacterium]|nr:aromatic amino acid ammonia-lyase [Myxococcales bacterium]